MNITEEQKQEADRVYQKYYDIWIKSDMTISVADFRKIVIQDRQSVLDVVKMSYNTCRSAYNEYWENEIQSLTNQIDYLKTKI